jgi:hypothetical protein
MPSHRRSLADLFRRLPASFQIAQPRSCSIYMPSLAPGIPFGKPTSLRWWLWHRRARVAETYLKGLMLDCDRLKAEPLAVQAAAARVQARCQTLYTHLANNMESLVDYGPSIVLGCRFRQLAQKVRSMTLPMPGWGSVEG